MPMDEYMYISILYQTLCNTLCVVKRKSIPYVLGYSLHGRFGEAECLWLILKSV